MRKISRYVSKTRLKLFAEGIFYSKLNYCLPVYGNVFGLEGYKDIGARYTSFTKEDNRKLQVLQNSVMRLLTNSPRHTPTTTLLKSSNSLSVQQLVASQTMVMVHKVIQHNRPAYLSARLKARNEDDGRRLQAKGKGIISVPNLRLSISREGFIYRGRILFNKLPEELRTEESLPRFKSGIRKWIVDHIPAKPS